MAKPVLRYFNMGPFPGYVGFCNCPKLFAKEIKRLKVPEEVSFMGNGAAVCHEFVGPKGQILIIAIDMEQAQGKSKEQIAAIIAHEAVHASQFLLNEIGEHKPGVETPAYIVGYLTQRCLQELWRD